jgi:endonuclease/exonuclease/phosphatase family metal-dependent hydrolase
VTRDPALLEECRALQRALEAYPTIARLRGSAEWPALQQRLDRVLGMVRRYQPEAAPAPSRDTGRVRAVHWNIEHGNWYDQIETALLHHPDLRDADLLMFNEIDLGMARAGNRDVAGDLAAALGRYGAWTPLFLETTPGRDDDTRVAAGRPNEESLFGIAILSRWPISATRRVRLPSPEAIQFNTERMIGHHVGLVATVERPGAPFVAVSAHLEVHRTRALRAAQVATLVEALRDERRPIMLAGDFNSHTFDRGRAWDPLFGAGVLMLSPDAALKRRLQNPDYGPAREPLFDVLKREGFDWQTFTDRKPTLRLRLERLDEVRALFGPLAGPARHMLRWAEARGRQRLDWFAGRGWRGGSGFTVEGLDGPGRASDHAPIVGEFM